MTIHKKAALISTLFLFIHCQQPTEIVDTRDVSSVVRENIITGNSEEVSQEFLEKAGENRILLIGETHYVQEHQEYVSTLLERLHALGYRIFFNEIFQSFSWMVEDYVNHDLDYLPDHIRFFDHYWLEAIRNFNAGLADSARFQFFYMDINHWRSNFANSLLEIEKIIGEQTLFAELKSREIDSGDYKSALSSLSNMLEQDPDRYRSQWGEKWYKRIREMIAVEIKSSDFRTHRDDALREVTMFNNIKSRIPDDPDTRVVVNCGFYHAQKNPLMGPKIKWLHQYFTENFPDKTYAIAFLGIKGERKAAFNDPNLISFDLTTETSGKDLVRIIADRAQANMSILPLNDILFKDNMRVTYVSGSTFHLAPGLQFDALVTYPYISVLQSMSDFEI